MGELEQRLRAYRDEHGIAESGSQPRIRPVNPVDMPKSSRQRLQDKEAEIMGEGVNSGCSEHDISELAAMELRKEQGEKFSEEESGRFNSLSQRVRVRGRC